MRNRSKAESSSPQIRYLDNAMRLARIDAALEHCQKHLQTSGANGTDIEKYLTAHLVVLACASFEEAIEGAIKERAARSGDDVLTALVGSAVGIVLRSIKTNELAGVLNRFSEGHKKRFQERMANSPQAETSFNSIVAHRHTVAHASGFSLSFNDFVAYYEKGHPVLDAFKDVVSA
jgi:hypothetical protein